MTVDDQSVTKAVDSTVAKPRRLRRFARASLPKWPLALVVALIVATSGMAAGVYYLQFRPDQQKDAAVAAAAKTAAEEGTIAVLSYSPESLTEDIAKAKSYLTGGFLDYYTHFTDQVFAAAAQQQQVTTNARVVRAAVEELQPESAVVLLFVDKVSTSKNSPVEMKPTTVRATMKNVNGSWLIEQFEPL